MQIVQIGHHVDKLPVRGYSGIGRVVAALHNGLDVVGTIATPGSHGERVVVANEGTAEALVETASRFSTADVFLTHTPEIADMASEAFGAERVIEMLHMPVAEPHRYAQKLHRLVGVSSAQLIDVWRFRPDAQFVWHGTPEAPIGAGDGGYVAWVGRFSQDKGPVDAIYAANSAGVPLVLVGKATNEEEERYFKEIVEPLLGRATTWLGELDSHERDIVVGRALALLAPTRVRDSFGLTVIEAAMVGTPVLGYPAGATREVLGTGIGRVCFGVNELAVGIQDAAAGAFSRRKVAELARELFSVEAQAARMRHLLEHPIYPVAVP
jgi:glycosyltransferase involved in cell wall biosynthesis